MTNSMIKPLKKDYYQDRTTIFNKIIPFIAISSFSFLLLLPQLIEHQPITGSDMLFHYNRFYETAQQIKTGQFSYFISLFGFNQSGRIVNALYGPYFAYLQGFLVLLSGSWFHYQLVSRFLIGILAGLSMFSLLKKIKLNQYSSLTLAFLFMTTYAIQYWTFRQGFSSWGTAIFPWCLIPAVEVVQNQKVKSIHLAVAVATMLQIHTLSTLFLVICYIPFFAYGFLKNKPKINFVKKVAIAISICILLSLNILSSLISVGYNNQLVQPFINGKLYEATITQGSSNLLIMPFPLIVLFLLCLISIIKWKNFSPLLSISMLTLMLFTWLSSGFFPWYQLVSLKLSIVNLIQFPFRFFYISTVLLFLTVALIIKQLTHFKYRHYIHSLLTIAALIGLGQSLSSTNIAIQHYKQTNEPIQRQLHQFVYGSEYKIRQSFYSKDLKQLLILTGKSTPDYLPTDRGNKKNKYKLYEKYILQSNKPVIRTVKNSTLSLTWISQKSRDVHLPIIIYHDTRITLNNKPLTSKDYKLTDIHTSIIKQKSGKNTLTINYPMTTTFKMLFIINISSWISLCAATIFSNSKKALNQSKTD